MGERGVLSIVGIGPGASAHTSPAALEAIKSSDVVVGYITYIKLVRHLIEGKEVIKTGMTEEIGRARAAVERARDGAKVAIISSGDAGIYTGISPYYPDQFLLEFFDSHGVNVDKTTERKIENIFFREDFRRTPM